MLFPPSIEQQFKEDLENLHLLYDYDARNEHGEPELWRYEMWFRSSDRIVYAIHGGPMAGRLNYQKADYQCIRPGELWQCNWLEETGTICSLVYDIPNRCITTMLGFSIGHWSRAKDARGDKRNPEDFTRWRELAKVGDSQADRHLLSERANVKEIFFGPGKLQDINLDAPTL